MIEVRQTREFAAWLRNLRDRVARQRIGVRLARLAKGWPGDIKSIGSDVGELRFHFGPGYRVYLTRFEVDGVVIVLLLGGDKDSQSRDIAVAQQLAKRERPK